MLFSNRSEEERVISKNPSVRAFVTSGRSLIYVRNKSGPRTVPWGTPYCT